MLGSIRKVLTEMSRDCMTNESLHEDRRTMKYKLLLTTNKSKDNNVDYTHATGPSQEKADPLINF